MLLLLSPAKKQSPLNAHIELPSTTPQALSHIKPLIKTLKTYSASQLKTLMSISDALAKLNVERYKAFNPNHFTHDNANQAIFTFQGDAYRGIAVDDFTERDLTFLQEHLLILSGLYGYLRPLDLIQPYRLEMKTPLTIKPHKNLYDFWGNTITKAINSALQSHKNKTLINLASNEYFKAIQPGQLQGQLITVHFKEKKGDQYKVISIHAKRARGLMTHFITKNRIDTPQKLMDFSLEKYCFNKKLSSDQNYVFTR